jgi:pimeloyl-ACP methyl ester carboxylesterase
LRVQIIRRKGKPEWAVIPYEEYERLRDTAARAADAEPFMPDADADLLSSFTYLQQTTTTPENAACIRFANDEVDISGEPERITAPTLVLHARADAMVPFEEGLRIAAAVPDAGFVHLESHNHILLPNEPAWQRFLDEVGAFLAG